MPTAGPELRDIHVPQVSMWWPLAPGWWLLLVLLLAAVAVGVIFLRRRAAWKRHVEATLADLRDATARYAQDGDVAAFATAASQLLRRVARTRDPHSVVMKGAAWRAALAAMAPRQDVHRLAAIEDAIYRPEATLDVTPTAQDVEAWVRKAMRRRPSHVAA
ncbi:MAG TPA: DUF4381 domain-containing protein [Luteibacter sp.]|uniref:DUF4381 domain-containing protein n=1 Tax=Luteibacter sp. TaxID=1886636 RepID=UPI002C83EF97|nr:DUF4381 domain-containing protein [Luteibacter sp.]HVI53430.1 DUF4381 domain-containing protein [Luteibacter sp.]